MMAMPAEPSMQCLQGTGAHLDDAHLFACHEGALIPAERQPRSAQWKELGYLEVRPNASRQQEAELKDARAALEVHVSQPTHMQS